MTTEDGVPLPQEERTRRHRLVPRSVLEAKYQQRYDNPAVSTYALAVRDVVENCPEIGPIDTWQKLADQICLPRPDRDRSLWRKKLSRHFTAESKGPPWQTVVLVVEHALPPEARRQQLAHFAELYALARGEKPPTGTRDERAEGATGALSGPDLERELRQKNTDLERKLLACMVEISKLRADQAGQSLGGDLAPDALPRQREPLSGPPAGTPNTRHFPTSQARAGGSTHGHYRAQRLDTGSIGLPGQPPYLTDEPWHSRNNLRNHL
ncbi:hypothetical protein ABZU25_07645 [Micromonospora sp. NPDC005215]|uniref:hypothetical protein n=1 Tax=Micromonospora sp. NPDC005215 TaxID=3157024 RepID=UPI0033A00CC4